jgi:hypothetical protein
MARWDVLLVGVHPHYPVGVDVVLSPVHLELHLQVLGAVFLSPLGSNPANGLELRRWRSYPR